MVNTLALACILSSAAACDICPGTTVVREKDFWHPDMERMMGCGESADSCKRGECGLDCNAIEEWIQDHAEDCCFNEYDQCTREECGSELASASFPTGWGSKAADDIAAINNDASVKVAVHCVCRNCNRFDDLKAWPANEGKTDGPGCQAAFKGSMDECQQVNCLSELESADFPEGWGQVAADDIASVEKDSGIRAAIACLCAQCATHDELKGWVANNGKADGPGCQAAQPGAQGDANGEDDANNGAQGDANGEDDANNSSDSKSSDAVGGQFMLSAAGVVLGALLH